MPPRPPLPSSPPLGFFKKTWLRALAGWRGADTVWYDAIWKRREQRAADLLAAGVPASGLDDEDTRTVSTPVDPVAQGGSEQSGPRLNRVFSWLPSFPMTDAVSGGVFPRRFC